MKKNTMYVCIMAGGKGERFWPLSRDAQPKQFLKIVGTRALIAETAARNRALVPPSHLLIMTTKDQAHSVTHAVPNIPAKNIVAEPVGKNTAPCIGLACALIAREHPCAVMAVVPSDHVIADTKLYTQTMREAATIARREHVIVTIGIRPRFPETGYGYILAGARVAHNGSTRFSRVKQFVEKPARPRAEKLIATGHAVWNAGMFVFRISDMLDTFRRFLPRLHVDLSRVVTAPPALLARAIRDVYAHAPNISIDYAIMEKAHNVIVAHGEFAWDDVGSWSAVADHWRHDSAGNVARGAVAAIDSSGCILANECPGVVGVVGLHDMVVVRTGDALLVCPKDKAQDVKKLVQHHRHDKRLKAYTR